MGVRANMKSLVKNFTRGYDSVSDRERAITQLIKQGYNYFVKYQDTNAFYALQYGKGKLETEQKTVSIQ